MNQKGQAAFQAKDWNQAIAYFGKAVELDPADPTLRRNLNHAYGAKSHAEASDKYRRGDFDGAIALLDQATRYLPESRKLWDALGEARKQKRHGEARRDIAAEKAVEAERERRARSTVTASLEAFLDRQQLEASPGGRSALEQLLIAEAAARRARSEVAEGAKAASGIPFDTGPPVLPDLSTSSIEGAPPTGTGGRASADLVRTMDILDSQSRELDVALSRERDPQIQPSILTEQIRLLDQESGVLEVLIRRERDPLKRAELIDKQTFLVSKIATREIELVDLSVRPPGSTMSEQQEKEP